MEDPTLSRLAELWTRSNKSQAAIAAELGRPASSVAYTAQKLGLMRQNPPTPWRPRTRQPPVPLETRPSPRAFRAARPVHELLPGMCKWPVNDGSPYLFCCEPREFPNDDTQSPYCAFHRSIATVPRR